MPIETVGKSTSIEPERKETESVSDPTALTNFFEFWPAWSIHIPMYLIGIYHGVRLGCLNFFPAVNPGMTNGGLFNYSKFDSMVAFPKENIPLSIRSKPPHNLDLLLEKAVKKEISFPVIFKPDIGERGRGVKLIPNPDAAKLYLQTFRNETIILQEFISKKEEYGVFVQKDPKSGKLKITSITQKIPLQVVGNGLDTVWTLVQRHPRASRYRHEIPKELMHVIPEQDRIFPLSVKGNHCKGATFLDRAELINAEVETAFETICQSFIGFYYGRLDVKVESSEELSIASGVSILEVNGTNSEPIHIYSAGNSYFKSIGIIADFFAEMGSIACFNLKPLNPKPRFSDLLTSFQAYLHLKKNTHE
jgi:hypothetical protein